ncbi:N-acetyltransferase [Methanobrevibacter sp.]|uniref:N-acetyltransferase n=1 Tax=Methanobrevibacter sp. TaxID=66852 RepID=UPI0026DFCA2C|nr:N-acetyltransferase [Methanobrevibacter sp.]MDO5860247.1 N-acetyltransferase [Methanobrevibacter sp.]
MDIEYIKENYKFETLTEKHDLSNFECDSDDLNDFIKNDALKQQEDKINITKLITCDDEIIGFVSLLTDIIPLKNIRDENIRLELKPHYNENIEKVPKRKPLPAIKIGRFAIDKKYTNNGLGSHILRNVINSIRKLSENDVGLRFIVVEGYASAYNFYVVHNNFSNLKKDDELIKEKLDRIIKQNPEQTFYLYLDLKKS